MQRAVVWGIVLVCLTVLIAGSGATAQRTPIIDAATTRTPSQVEVVNFPAVQAVNGTVNVGNLPAVQTVAGNVAISNLPVDADGRLLVAVPRQEVHFIGYTTSRFENQSALTPLNQACAAEVPGSRICKPEDFYFGIPAGTLDPADPCALFAILRGGDALLLVGIDIDLDKGAVNQCFTVVDPLNVTYRVACCGY